MPAPQVSTSHDVRPVRPARWLTRAGWALLVGCLVGFAAGIPFRRSHPGANAFFDLYLYNGVFLAAAGLCLCGRSADRRVRWAWRLLALGLVLEVVGQGYSSVVLD